jgi:mono/diheme cytochrome c family protein
MIEIIYPVGMRFLSMIRMRQASVPLKRTTPGNPGRGSLIAGLVILLSAGAGDAGVGGHEAFLTKHCVSCHDADSKKGKLDLSALAWNPVDRQAFERWVKVFDRVDKHEMPPPKEKDQPDEAARGAFLKSLRGDLHAAGLARQQAEGRVVLRRLNRAEYENTVHDLLAVDLPLQHYLPEDVPSQGFDNVSEGLRLSTLHMEQYLEAADAAITAALDLRMKPEGVSQRFRYQDEESITDDQKLPAGKPRSFKVLPDSVVIFDDNSPTTVRQYSYKTRGQYRIKIACRSYQAAGRPTWLKLYSTDFKTSNLLGYFDLPADGRREVEVTGTIEQGQLLELKPFDTNYNEKGLALWGHDAGTYPGRGIAIEYIEVEGPLVKSWPPPSVAKLFGDLPVKPIEPAKADRHGPAYTIVAGDARAAAEKCLRDFVSRAFRRPATPAEVERYVRLMQRELDAGQSFEEAMRVAFRAVLIAPGFLFFEERPGKLDDWALASRLSYFLWSSCPDDELRSLAAQGELHKTATLRAQVERLLNSPRAGAFVTNFTGQWLELRQIDFTQPDKKLYPEFDDLLKAAMLTETKSFFAEMLREDLKPANFIHSDFLMVNRILAEHYGIAGVVGEEFRRVPVPAGSHRGGVLTQAAILKVTANGTATSPVIRGAWVAKRLLGEPLPPPPADVPAFEPDTRGSTTIREQLAKHRALPACASCHTRMDPPGFALENFDAIGGWRDRYRGEKGERSKKTFRGRDLWEYNLGAPVDATGELPDGRKFAGFDDFKQLLLERQDQVARNLIQNLLVYATGAGVQFSDRATVEAILTRLTAKSGGLRSIVHEIVESDVFQNK